MQFIEPNLFDCPGFAVGQDDRFADELGFSFVELNKDRGRSHFCSRHYGTALREMIRRVRSQTKARSSRRKRDKTVSPTMTR